jgi:hypothetical protein
MGLWEIRKLLFPIPGRGGGFPRYAPRVRDKKARGRERGTMESSLAGCAFHFLKRGGRGETRRGDVSKAPGFPSFDKSDVPLPAGRRGLVTFVLATFPAR